MKRKIKLNPNFVMITAIIMTVLIAVIRIFNNTTQNVAFVISGMADGRVKLEDASFLELNFDAPISGMTGFSFEFEGNREEFGEASILIIAEVVSDVQEKDVLYHKEIALVDQAYDYQNACFKVMIPFGGEVVQGEHLRIAIMGVGLPEKSNVYIKTSRQSVIADAVFEVNDFVQDSILSGRLYYQRKGVEIIPIVRECVVFILLILLAKEVWETKNKRGKSEKKNKVMIYGNRLLSLLPVLFVLLIALDYVYYAGIMPRLEDLRAGREDLAYEKGETTYMELCDGEALFRELGMDEDNLRGLRIYLEEPYNENGVFTIELSDTESQELVVSTKRMLYEIPMGEKGGIDFKFDSLVKKSSEAEYLVAIYYSGEPVKLLMIDDGQNHPVVTPLYRKNNFLKPLFGILAILVIGFSVLMFWCIQNKMKVEKFLFITIVLLGILFETVITPFAVPDEAAHIDTAYRISNRMLGTEETGMKDAIFKRECDNYTDSGIKRNVSVDSYRWVYEDWLRTEGNRKGQLVFAADTRANADSLFFLPASLGITLGRILGIGFLPMIFLARTANLLVCAWMIYLAIKKLPFGKSILCVISLLPITLQEIASCSYDALIIGVSALYVSYCVFAINSRRRLEKKDILVILITAAMLGMCKGGVYTPLYLLGVWILIKRGYIRVPQSKRMRIAGWIAAAGAALFCIVVVVYFLRQPIDAHHLRYATYPLAYLVQHPIKTIRIFENTLYMSIHDYVVQCIGMEMGYFQISAKFIAPIGYSILIGMAVLCDERHPYIVDKKEKGVFLASAIMSAGAILLAFFISYTIFGEEAIGGVQGRYFIPILWLGLISVRGDKIVHKKKPYRKMVSMGYVLGVCTVLQIVINALRQ